jgi:hypothetical protein
MRFVTTSPGFYVGGLAVPAGAIIDTQNGIDIFSVGFRGLPMPLDAVILPDPLPATDNNKIGTRRSGSIET